LELIKIKISFFLLRLSRVFKQEVLSLVFSRWRCWGNQIVKQKPGGGGGGVEARDFTVSEGHGHPLVKIKWIVSGVGVITILWESWWVMKIYIPSF
jgi:hypothetical protein